MAQRGPALAELHLSDDERAQLERWVRRRKVAQDLVLRSRIVLECATGASNSEVADSSGRRNTLIAEVFNDGNGGLEQED